LLPLDGRPLLAWSIAAACASQARPIIVTLGRAADAVATALPAGPYATVVNHHFADGMGTSLALAVGQLPPDVAGALFLLGDQPFMPTVAIEAVLAAARERPERIAMGVYGGHRGHPVYLPRRVFAHLLALKDDEGARTIIARAGDDITLVPITAEHALLDVDTMEDYQRAQALAPALAQSSEKTPS
jgi:molybdenum cofactor cytidylyltransferase